MPVIWTLITTGIGLIVQSAFKEVRAVKEYRKLRGRR